jgi:aspartate/methionine/tyrosine aminotransferase
MKHPSLYLDWYIRVPEVKHDFRASGASRFKYRLALGEVDFSLNYVHGNPRTCNLLASRYDVQPENVFVSAEGATGQNSRVIRLLAEKNPKKTEAIVEHPTYEPLLRIVQEHFPIVKRLKRNENDAYRLDADDLRKVASNRTGLLLLTNPHLPSGAVSDADELREIMNVARENGFYAVCDEVYAEFSRNSMPTIFSVDSDWGMVTTSFTKAYGLSGLRMGATLASRDLVNELYTDALNTIGSGSNLVEIVTQELLTNGSEALEKHTRKWVRLKKEAEKWLSEKGFDYFPNRVGITCWVKLPMRDTHRWVNEHAVPHHSVAAVPGTFFLFRNDYRFVRSNMIRLGLGNIDPDGSDPHAAFAALENAINTYRASA